MLYLRAFPKFVECILVSSVLSRFTFCLLRHFALILNGLQTGSRQFYSDISFPCEAMAIYSNSLMLDIAI